MADNIIFEKNTRIVAKITSDLNPELARYEDSVVATEKLNIGNGTRRIGLDGKTKTRPTQQQIDSLKETKNPELKIKRELNVSINDLKIAQPVMAPFLNKLKVYINGS